MAKVIITTRTFHPNLLNTDSITSTEKEFGSDAEAIKYIGDSVEAAKTKRVLDYINANANADDYADEQTEADLTPEIIASTLEDDDGFQFDVTHDHTWARLCDDDEGVETWYSLLK